MVPSMPDDLDVAVRIGVAWRELRRGGTAQAFRRELYGDAVDLGVIDALDLLVGHGPCRMSELAEALRVDPSTATRAVDRLVEAGYVERRPSPDDARVVVVAPTSQGLHYQTALSERRRAAMLELVSGFDADERRQLADLLERLVGAIDAYIRRS